MAPAIDSSALPVLVAVVSAYEGSARSTMSRTETLRSALSLVDALQLVAPGLRHGGPYAPPVGLLPPYAGLAPSPLEHRDAPEPVRTRVSFEEENGRTRVTLRLTFATAAAREEAAQYGAAAGAQQALGSLAGYLATL